MIGPYEVLLAIGPTVPALAVWIAVIIFGAVMRGRSGGRAERFLITGAALKLAGTLLVSLSIFMMPWLISRGYSMDYANAVNSGLSYFINFVSMAGIAFLVYAFWVKYQEKRIKATPGVAP